MTDIGVTNEHTHGVAWSIPSRLGATAQLCDGTMTGDLRALPATLVHGALRVSAVVFLVDAVAGLAVDTDPDSWCFTADLSVRMPAMQAPDRVLARAEILRMGGRSASASVPLSLEDGADLGLGLLTFARVPRRDGDPEKHDIDVAQLAALWAAVPPLDVPLRDAAGIEVLDAERGVVSMPLRPDLLNPAGALQGAMVALVAEAAAEELASAAAGRAQIVTDIDVRYLTQARTGPVQSRARFIGPPHDGSIAIDLLDAGLDGKLLTTVTARTRPAPA